MAQKKKFGNFGNWKLKREEDREAKIEKLKKKIKRLKKKVKRPKKK